MKIRTVKYIVKEGVINAYKNKLMSLASVGIVTASLIIFGTFLLIILNLNQNMEMIKQKPELIIFCQEGLDEGSILQIERNLTNNSAVKSYSFVSAKQAYEEFKKELGEELLGGYDENTFPAEFNVSLHDDTVVEDEIDMLEGIPGVDEVSYSQAIIEFISKVSNWVNIISLLLIIIFFCVSVFIIANTIKLTVFSRRKEINIMKYIGATDWFIRWPFVVEGIVIGVIGALISFIMTRYGYGALESRFNQDLSEFFVFIKIEDVSLQLMVFYALIGGIVGALGSFVSIRKYLRV